MLKIMADADQLKKNVKKEIGRGGEAIIYLLPNDLVAKVYLKPRAAEFAKSKFTLHIKHQAHGPPYWCNSVARSVASGVPVVMDKESWRRGLFESLVVHNVSGMVLDSVRDIIAYLQRVPDDEYIRLRNSTLHHGRFLREPPPPEKVQETRDFFWKVYSDTSWVFEGKPLNA